MDVVLDKDAIPKYPNTVKVLTITALAPAPNQTVWLFVKGIAHEAIMKVTTSMDNRIPRTRSNQRQSSLLFIIPVSQNRTK